MNQTPEVIVKIKGLKTYLGGHWVHEDLDLDIQRGEVLGIVGGSGSGKTTLMREILGLTPSAGGSIEIFGHELTTATPATLLAIQKRWGVLFQQNALFSSLNVLENVAFPLQEHTSIDKASIQELALLKIIMAGLPIDAAIKYPAELSGGMQKRAGLARAIVLDPELIFLDEPTAGLDPNTAAELDQLVLNLQSTMGLTIVIITHDLDTLWTVTDRVAFLGEKKVLAVKPMAELMQDSHPLIKEFFSGERSKVAQDRYSAKEE